VPAAYTIDTSRCLVLSRGWGVLTGEDLLSHVQALAADPRFVPTFHQLVELRDVTGALPTAAAIRQLVLHNPFREGSRRAVVVGSDLAYGLARMYEMMRANSPDLLEVFRDMDLALEWLGIPGERDAILAELREVPPMSGTA
jgi:hypothetical protein